MADCNSTDNPPALKTSQYPPVDTAPPSKTPTFS